VCSTDCALIIVCLIFFIFATEGCLVLLLMASKKQTKIKSSAKLIPSFVHETEDMLPLQCVMVY